MKPVYISIFAALLLLFGGCKPTTDTYCERAAECKYDCGDDDEKCQVLEEEAADVCIVKSDATADYADIVEKDKCDTYFEKNEAFMDCSLEFESCSAFDDAKSKCSSEWDALKTARDAAKDAGCFD